MIYLYKKALFQGLLNQWTVRIEFFLVYNLKIFFVTFLFEIWNICTVLQVCARFSSILFTGKQNEVMQQQQQNRNECVAIGFLLPPLPPPAPAPLPVAFLCHAFHIVVLEPGTEQVRDTRR